MAEATLSSKNRIVVPLEARKALGVKPGDKLLIVVRGSTVTMLPKPAAYHTAIRRIARGVYPKGYVSKERQSWD